MLAGLPPQSLGWLLVDEAGQAPPQAAVGALLRTRHALVAGDPLQIEPVVTLPDGLIDVVCRHFGVDANRFAAPSASVQTLADSSTSYCAEFRGNGASRVVGGPLLVHRRCASPMFDVSNAIAYGGQMVNAKKAGASAIRHALGPSAWIDVQGPSQDKWCPQEGDEVLALLRKMAESNAGDNVYIITPFRMVAENLRKLVVDSGVLSQWLPNSDAWERWAAERIGTVHTVQGREAEAVFFVLGASSAESVGARIWAGSRPNLVNVAVTRAKEALYVIGDKGAWRSQGVFQELSAALDRTPGVRAT